MVCDYGLVCVRCISVGVVEALSRFKSVSSVSMLFVNAPQSTLL